MSDMAGVLLLHQDWTDDYAHKCSCGWTSMTAHTQSHQAAALTAAGFGPVQAARAEAWDECESASYEIRLDPTGKFWEPYKVNPYRAAVRGEG